MAHGPLVLIVWVFRPTRQHFTHMETSPLLVKAPNVDQCSTLMVIEQCGFFSVPHLLRHGASVYNGYLRGPVTLTPVAERLAAEKFWSGTINPIQINKQTPPPKTGLRSKWDDVLTCMSGPGSLDHYTSTCTWIFKTTWTFGLTCILIRNKHVYIPLQ